MGGLLRGMARTAVVAGTATAVSNRVSRRQAGRWAEQDRMAYQQQAYQQQAYEPQYQQQPPAGQTAEPGLSMDEKLSQLRELGALREQGILSEAEFEVQKHRVLNG